MSQFLHTIAINNLYIRNVENKRSVYMNNQIDVLSPDDANLFIELFESSLRLNQREHFFSWLQGLFQYLLPHEVLICAYRSSIEEPFSYEKFVSTRYFKDEQFAQVVDPDNGLLSKVMASWQKVQHPILLADDLELGDFGIYSTPYHLRKGAMQSLELKNAAAHGITCANGDILSFFMFARVDSQPLSTRHAYLLELFVPHFHVILTRLMASRQNIPMSLNMFRNKLHKQKSSKARVTSREQDILKWMQAGKTNHEIAQILEISPLTVKNHVHNILKKLGVENRSNACHKASKMGLIN